MAAYEPRAYRKRTLAAGLVGFEVVVKETDLQIWADRDLTDLATDSVLKCRKLLEAHGKARPEFLSSLEPLETPSGVAPVARSMYDAARIAGVGPMAAVAGAVAEFVGHDLLEHSNQVIIENGGDLYLKSDITRTVGIYAGSSPISERVGVEVPPEATPLALCTSSGTVGHSLSFGRADAACVAAKDAALADALATALGNRIQTAADIEPALEWVFGLPGVLQAIVVIGDRIGMKGSMMMRPLGPAPA